MKTGSGFRSPGRRPFQVNVWLTRSSVLAAFAGIGLEGVEGEAP
jgi:hypothetical protein